MKLFTCNFLLLTVTLDDLIESVGRHCHEHAKPDGRSEPSGRKVSFPLDLVVAGGWREVLVVCHCCCVMRCAVVCCSVLWYTLLGNLPPRCTWFPSNSCAIHVIWISPPKRSACYRCTEVHKQNDASVRLLFYTIMRRGSASSDNPDYDGHQSAQAQPLSVQLPHGSSKLKSNLQRVEHTGTRNDSQDQHCGCRKGTIIPL